MQEPQSKEALVDWRAVGWAGLLAGALQLGLILLWLPGQVGGDGAGMLRLMASVLVGEELLDATGSPPVGVLGMAIGLHFVIALSVAGLIALVLHRFGLWVGVFGGGLLGLCVYTIHMYAVAMTVAPQLTYLEGLPFALCHIAFGALAGGIYELLEVERYASEVPA